MLSVLENASLSCWFLCLSASGNSNLNSLRLAKRGVGHAIDDAMQGEFAEVCQCPLMTLAAARQLKNFRVV
jgi:hypothetical protein